MKKYVLFGILTIFLLSCSSLALALVDSTMTLSSGGSRTGKDGVTIIPYYNITIKNVTIGGGATPANTVYLQNYDTNAIIYSASITSYAALNLGWNVTQGVKYRLVVDRGGAAYDGYWAATSLLSPPGFPLNRTNIQFWKSIQYDAGEGTATLFSIQSIGSENNAAPTPPSYSLGFQGVTPADNAIQFIANNSFTVNISYSPNITSYNASNSTSLELFNSTGASIAAIIGATYPCAGTCERLSSGDTIGTFSNLTAGVYRYNVHSELANGTVIYSTNRTITIYNITPGSILVPSLNQNVTSLLNITWQSSSTTNNSVAISNYSIGLLNADGSYNRTLGVTAANNFSWSTYQHNLSVGMYRIQVQTFDVNGNNVNTSVQFNLTRNTLLNITAYDLYTNVSLRNISVNISDLTWGISEVRNTTSNSLGVDIVYGHAYSIFFDVPGYAYQIVNISGNASPVQYMNQSLIKTNSITIYLYDEVTRALLSGANVTVVLTATSINFTQTNNTVTGNLFVNGLPEAFYSLGFSAANYSSRTFYVTMTNRTAQSLIVYLLPGAITIGTYIRDPGDQPIDGALFTIQRLINNTWLTVAQGSTDGVGYIQFELENGGDYRGTITADGYQTRTFGFVPYYVNQPYTFKLQETTVNVFTPFNTFVGYSYAPTARELNRTNVTFSFTTVQLNSSYGSNSVLWTAINCSGVWNNNSGSPSGVTVMQTLDLSNYDGNLKCMLGLQVDGYEPYIFLVNYYVPGYVPAVNNSISKGAELLEENNSAAWNAILGLFIIFIIVVAVRFLSGGDPEAVTISGMAGLLIISIIGLVNMPMGILICFEIGMIFFNRGGA